ncbi:hypothetical protein BST97_11910 [Nonlabens spongiae]|uniref:PorZ N-terminal beta-propeller domain-containing protein n=1 Tax=Nonlabens spongiae TaxID=331648 RepID=A0A1W6MM43_9FLAO|nr:T9SS type A sorting domain-containing protein [Nonlabens spongiae]ARN78637.1 hypothetical protein BST97_11910 [Nonlabens spongiae]
MKYLFFFLLLATSLSRAQDFSESWEGYFSFSQIVDVESGDGSIYVAGINAIKIIDPVSNSSETLSTINGLLGDEISTIFYSTSKEKLVIGYRNGTLQILDNNGDLTTEVAITDKQTISAERKRINGFFERGDLLYMATEFGVALYDLERLEFNDTYFIGDGGSQVRVSGLEFFEGQLYATTIDSGILRADLTDPFLLDFSNWIRVIGFPWDAIVEFNEELLAININPFIWELNNDRFVRTPDRIATRALDYAQTGQYLFLLSANQIKVYDRNFTEVTIIDGLDGEQYKFTSMTQSGGDLYVGTEQNGLLRIDFLNTLDFEFIEIDGPLKNGVFSVTTGESGVWVGFGNYDIFYNPFPLESYGISRLREEQPWDNYSFEDILMPRSVSSILINPSNPEQVFINSMRDGVVNFEPEVNVFDYNETNSSLTPLTGEVDHFRIPSSGIDPQGNFWFVNSISEEPLHRLAENSQWTGFDFDDEFPDLFAGISSTKVEFDTAGRVYWGTVSRGLFAFDPATDQVGQLIDEVGQGNLINPYIGALRIDQNNTLWIGSTLGLRVLSNPSSILDEEVRDSRPIIIEDQNGIPRELLADQAILDIEVDGNNNKWVATSDSGAYLFSPSGQETIFQFTKDNSPLPVNTVNDISIDFNTGKVYFATDGGLVSFQGARSSAPREDLTEVFAFPNPVRPGFDGNVIIDGLTDRARVKITDVEGNLVYEAISQGGSIPWDTRSFSGNKVASGVYFLLVNTDDTIETTVFKLMIIR